MVDVGLETHRAPPSALSAKSTRTRALSRGAAAASGPALAVTYLSLLVLLPLAAILSQAFTGGPAAFWREATSPESLAALELTVVCSLIVAVFNALAGLLIAWVMVRDEFAGKRVVNAVIDLPFALPTVVAGLTLLSLYGPSSPFGVNVAGTRVAIVLALAFVTLPFSVRTVQPVIAVLISGSLPYKTQVASAWIYSLYGDDFLPYAAAVSTVLVVLALALLLGMGWLRRRFDVGGIQ